MPLWAERESKIRRRWGEQGPAMKGLESGPLTEKKTDQGGSYNQYPSRGGGGAFGMWGRSKDERYKSVKWN